MKYILFLFFATLSSSAFASKFANIKVLSNQKLELAANGISKTEVVTHASKKKILVFSASGKTMAEMKKNTVAQAIHLLCPFFDDGVALTLASHDETGATAAAHEFVDENYSNSKEGLEQIRDFIQSTQRVAGVEVYSGTASGNNTSGTVLGIYDVNQGELAVFASTNCGSDN